MYRTLLWALLSAASSFAVSSTAQSSAGPGRAVVYIYQKGSFGNGQYDLWINGQKVVERFQARSYFSIQVPAGRHCAIAHCRPPAIFCSGKKLPAGGTGRAGVLS
jgi:hypothetical protein